MSERRAIFYCPYCGGEDLRPQPEPAGAWQCAGCTNTFVVTHAHAARHAAGGATAASHVASRAGAEAGGAR